MTLTETAPAEESGEPSPAEHASQAYVRTLARAMYTARSGEIVQLERLLRSLGGTPLPAPEH